MRLMEMLELDFKLDLDPGGGGGGGYPRRGGFSAAAAAAAGGGGDWTAEGGGVARYPIPREGPFKLVPRQARGARRRRRRRRRVKSTITRSTWTASSRELAASKHSEYSHRRDEALAIIRRLEQKARRIHTSRQHLALGVFPIQEPRQHVGVQPRPSGSSSSSRPPPNFVPHPALCAAMNASSTGDPINLCAFAGPHGPVCCGHGSSGCSARCANHASRSRAPHLATATPGRGEYARTIHRV